MALQKQGINIPFGQGLDTKTDPNQVPPGKFLQMSNSIFNNNLWQKRNGYKRITQLPEAARSLTTFSGGLTAIGQELQAFSAPNNQWLNKGALPSIDLRVTQMGRTGYSQLTSDVAINSNGLACVVYQDGSGSYYQVVDLTNNDVILEPVLISAAATMPRVGLLQSYFIVTYLDTVTATPHLRYIAIPLGNVTGATTPADISTVVDANPTGYDILVANNRVYASWNASDGGGAIRITYLTNQLVVSSPKIISGSVGDIISMVVDGSGSTPNIWIIFYTTGTTTTSATLYDANLNQILAPTVVSTDAGSEFTGLATGGVLTIYSQKTVAYSYDSAIDTDAITKNTITSSGAVGSVSTVKLGLGIGARAFTHAGKNYLLATYGQRTTTSQPSYFLIDDFGALVCKLAYSNGIGFLPSSVLSSVVTYGGAFYLSYLFRDQIVPVNKTQGLPGAVNGIYSQNGVNLARFEFDVQQYTAEIAGALHITGGLLWMYDGSFPVEQGFNLWPENVEVSTATTGGLITAQQYFYQFCYEWTDTHGNIHRSAPSIPVSVTTTGSTSENTINVPTLRMTQKQNVRLVGYRWSAAQQVYYQFTSITNPILNNTAVNSIAVTDTLADSSILGNTIIYTTGGVIENIGAPACSLLTLYKSRLFLVTAEDRNLIWFSKQVIESTPVEMSDLLTQYVAPTIGSQGSTGDITALGAMDDKVVPFKAGAPYYFTGQGPDNTGANNDFTDPVFISSTVGCSNQASLVLAPQGLMFQSSKGIWLLGRDLSTSYIGADVEGFNDQPVVAAFAVPTANQIRFTLDNSVTLMYDYYYSQWGTFTNIPGISSTVYQNLHTYLDANNRVYQETPGLYLDGTNPVLMSCTTAWIKLTNLQGFQRAYFMYILGKYLSPHKLNVQVAYDYNPTITQSSIITPDNFSPNWGGESLWGSGTPYGGPSSVEQWRIFFRQQKCESIQITLSEIFDSTLGAPAGAGLTLSGLNFVIGAKKGYPRLNSSKSVG